MRFYLVETFLTEEDSPATPPTGTPEPISQSNQTNQNTGKEKKLSRKELRRQEKDRREVERKNLLGKNLRGNAEDIKSLIEDIQNEQDDYKRDVYITHLIGALGRELAKNDSHLTAALPYLQQSIQDNGIDQNEYLEFLQNYATAVNSTPISGTIAETAYNLIEQGDDSIDFSNKNSIIYNPSIYSAKNDSDNLFKFKSIIFVSDESNVQKYGLVNIDDKGNPTDEPITPKLLLDKNVEEIRKIIGRGQTKNKAREYTLETLLQKKGIKGKNQASIFLKDFIQRKYPGGKTVIDNRIKALRHILSKPSLWADFIESGIDISRGEDQAIKDHFDRFVKGIKDTEGRFKGSFRQMGEPFGKNNKSSTVSETQMPSEQDVENWKSTLINSFKTGRGETVGQELASKILNIAVSNLQASGKPFSRDQLAQTAQKLLGTIAAKAQSQ